MTRKSGGEKMNANSWPSVDYSVWEKRLHECGTESGERKHNGRAPAEAEKDLEEVLVPGRAPLLRVQTRPHYGHHARLAVDIELVARIRIQSETMYWCQREFN